LPTDRIRRENLQAATGERHLRFNSSGVRHISRLEVNELDLSNEENNILLNNDMI
jgi:hypothetical protein